MSNSTPFWSTIVSAIIIVSPASACKRLLIIRTEFACTRCTMYASSDEYSVVASLVNFQCDTGIRFVIWFLIRARVTIRRRLRGNDRDRVRVSVRFSIVI